MARNQDESFTPLCNCCGVAMCWDLESDEYEEAKEFWDNWKCSDCNPNYKGALQRWMEAHA